MQGLLSLGRPGELASSSVRVKTTARQGLLQGAYAPCSTEWWLPVCLPELRAQVGSGFLEVAGRSWSTCRARILPRDFGRAPSGSEPQFLLVLPGGTALAGRVGRFKEQELHKCFASGAFLLGVLSGTAAASRWLAEKIVSISTASGSWKPAEMLGGLRLWVLLGVGG